MVDMSNANRFEIRSGTDVGRAVAELRRRRGMNQEHAADLAGISKAYISKIETGRTSSLLEHELRTLRRLGARIVVEFDDDPS